MISRRSFILSTITGLVGSQIPIKPQTKALFIPHPAQIKFFSQVGPVSLYGIPYHQSDGTTGEWLGIKRS